ncbi:MULTISPECIES: Hsp70 family protein [Thiorhodovibrio]|uniref:Hsp70 family protein n=1 Tax=Thiorhodovibrio TaxID=61593 RepID=UPI0019134BA6|nr:Hsp70 family protein [Thiorhodovibrio litoralis]MBK5969949.1 heat-shock protein Hsp70 [Thiorhodovibrio winogradskyi]WPL12872.1 Heat shock protein 70 [Thiorhodovibrio litoralis]
MTDIIIGIDLGTTNSEVAVVRDGRPEILAIDGAKLLPSVVGLGDDGNLLVGQAARNQYSLYPERTIRSVKRRMGEDVHLSLGEQSYRPQEISALILKRLKQAAEQHLGESVGKAVITVPAYFSDAQRQATRDAGELAGLEVVRIINEPTAAALAYEADHQGSRTILVYDLGGGTFDVSVVRMTADITEVLASHGNNQLGGDDFDARLVEHVLNHLKNEHGIASLEDRSALARIQRACEAAKITLSDSPFARIEEEYLLEHQGQPLNLSLEISRSDYEDLIKSYIDETLEAVHTALKGAGLAVADLDEVLLVGGSTRTPLIQERLEQILGMQPRAEVDPDLCVAAGAAIQAAVISGQTVASVLVDVTPYTFGTSAFGDFNGEPYPFVYVPVIRKNTPLPVTKSEAFQTMYDGQTKIEVHVYQGEDPDALNNTEIGSFHVEGLGDVPAGNVIVMTFTLDLNGILQVTASEKRTGLEKQITIDNATARFEEQELEAARNRLSALIDGEAERVDDDAATGAASDTAARRENVQAQALIEKAERLMESANADDKEDLVDMTEAVRDALEANDPAAIERTMAELSDLVFYLES